MEIRDEQAFWDDVRLAIWRASSQFLNVDCMRQIQRSVFRDLHWYIKSDEVLLREAESGIPSEEELWPERVRNEFRLGPSSCASLRLTSTQKRIGVSEADYSTMSLADHL